MVPEEKQGAEFSGQASKMSSWEKEEVSCHQVTRIKTAVPQNCRLSINRLPEYI
jgi:hypothetical protein